MRKKGEVVEKQVQIIKEVCESKGKDSNKYYYNLGICNALLWLLDNPEEETNLEFETVKDKFKE